MFGRRRDAWVYLKGLTETSAIGAEVELVERHAHRRAGPDGGFGGGYAWAIFPETPDGTYTVRVTYPSGARQQGRLIVRGPTHLLRLDEADAGQAGSPHA